MKNLCVASLASILAAEATAAPVLLDVALGKPVVLANQPQTAYLEVSLTGAGGEAKSRAPVNLSIVLDRSSSMNGDKIEKAKEAALRVLERLGADDIVSVVTYDSGVEVLVPATRMADKDGIEAKIRSIEPRGSTALFAGVSKGILEVRRFLDANRVNRVILLSDGQANIGPSSPNELGRLGASCAKEGISVTTIGLGLGYNEDLMVQLAEKSDGNHGFAATSAELTKLFDYELGDVLSVVAQEVSVKVTMPEGVTPKRILNRAGEIAGRQVVFAYNQLYAKQEKYALIEVDLPVKQSGAKQIVADVEISFADMTTGKTERIHGRAEVTYSDSGNEVERSENRDVMVAAIEALAVEANKNAVALRDKGDKQQAQRLLLDNAVFLENNATRYSSPRLGDYARGNRVDADNLDGDSWIQQRKAMKKKAHELETRQSY
jgi:Ca-activated chloride channel family protein